jgi:hypothetical protein
METRNVDELHAESKRLRAEVQKLCDRLRDRRSEIFEERAKREDAIAKATAESQPVKLPPIF